MSLFEAEKVQKAGKHKKAIELYQLAIKDDPYNSKVYEGLSISLYCSKDFDGALEAAAKAEELNPASAIPHLRRFAVYCDQKQLEKAKAEILKAIELEPNSSDVLCAYGVFHFLDKNMEQAITYEKKALEIDPNNYCARQNLGFFYGSIKNYKNAVREDWEAFKIRPSFRMAVLIVLESLAGNPIIYTGLVIGLCFSSIAFSATVDNWLFFIVPLFLSLFFSSTSMLAKYTKQRKPFWAFVGLFGMVISGWLIYVFIAAHPTK